MHRSGLPIEGGFVLNHGWALRVTLHPRTDETFDFRDFFLHAKEFFLSLYFFELPSGLFLLFSLFFLLASISSSSLSSSAIYSSSCSWDVLVFNALVFDFLELYELALSPRHVRMDEMIQILWLVSAWSFLGPVLSLTQELGGFLCDLRVHGSRRARAECYPEGRPVLGVSSRVFLFKFSLTFNGLRRLKRSAPPKIFWGNFLGVP